MSGNDEHAVRLAVVERDVGALKDVVAEIRDSTKEISGSLRTLTSLEVHHSETREAVGRAHGRIDDHEVRLRVIEGELPTLKEVRKWVIAGVLGVVCLVGAASFGAIFVRAGTPVPAVAGAVK